MVRDNGRLSSNEYMLAAIAFADEHGLEAMTMRALGEVLGVDPTAVYRHFPSKEGLISSMVDWFLGEILDRAPIGSPSPREHVVAMSLTTRTTFRRHPELGRALVQFGPGDGQNGSEVTRRTVEGLRGMGFTGELLVRSYQALEGFVMGSCVFDFTGAPHNFEVRRLRYRALEIPEFDVHAGSASAVEELADAAFILGLNTLLDGFASLISTVTD